MPDTGNVPLIADMSSEIMSRPLPWNKLSMVYAGAQKNIAPSGVVLIVMRKSLIEQARKDLPVYLRYDTHAELIIRFIIHRRRSRYGWQI